MIAAWLVNFWATTIVKTQLNASLPARHAMVNKLIIKKTIFIDYNVNKKLNIQILIPSAIAALLANFCRSTRAALTPAAQSPV